MRVELCAFADEAADAFTEQIAALDRNGIRKIELRGVNGCNVRDLSDTAARAAAAELRAAGISVWSIGSPLGKSDIGADFAPAQALLRRLLTLCEIFSCDKIRVFSFFTRDPAADKAEVLRRLRILTETAAAYGVRLYHENEKDIFGDTAARVEQLLDAVPLLCSVYDPANYVQVGETQENMQRAAARAGYYHIKDALRANGATVPAGEGDGEIGALLASLQGDAVLIATPHYSHPALGMRAFARGLHVLSEKPTGVHALQAAQLNESAEKSGKLFGVMFNQRANPLHMRLHALMQEGAVGELKSVRWIVTNWYRTQHYYDAGGWRATWAGEGGGVLINQAVH